MERRAEILSNKTVAPPLMPESLPSPSPWPNANARLLGLGLGLPVAPLDRLAQFDAKEFERFTLEWAEGYLRAHINDVVEVQQRGGAGDKGRDIVVWIHPATNPLRYSLIYQCKHYAAALGSGVAAGEIAKLLHYTFTKEVPVPRGYWFVTHKGVTGPLQDQLDDPPALQAFILNKWEDHCAKAVSSKFQVELTPEFRAYIEAFDFSIFKAKQPQELLDEHAKTRYHLTVFGLPLIQRPPATTPPSTADPLEATYIAQLYAVISEALQTNVSAPQDFAHDGKLRALFDRSRITFYFAEGLKELARDQMADPQFFETLLEEFGDGLYHHYTTSGLTGLQRLIDTVKASQALQLSAHILAPHVQAKDREGMCHQLANVDRLNWRPHPGLVVIDSPLTAFSKQKRSSTTAVDGSPVAPGVEARFWSSLTRIPPEVQVIIVENKAPPENVAAAVNFTWFAGESAEDGERYGFFPPQA